MITSITFWAVLAATAVIFWCLPSKFRLGFLAVASLGYLLTIEPISILVLVGWSLLFYILAPMTRNEAQGRWYIPILILGIVGYLAWFKYIPPLVEAFAGDSMTLRLMLPLGISYFTFKLIHYLLEVSRNNIKPHTIWEFACYIFLFPIFTAGPIERFDNFLAQRETDFRQEMVWEGLTRIAHGLIKKFVFAAALLHLRDRIVPMDALAVNTDLLTMPEVWGFCILTYLFAYMDFSAYSDIAIGASRLFGLRIMENFNWPIVARNVGDFWRRWHISLSSWCQTYIYMPTIGWTRNPYPALFATFVAIGLWHGGTLNFLLFGLYHATGAALTTTWLRLKRKRKWKMFDGKPWGMVGIPLTFLFISSSFIISTTSGTDVGFYGALRLLAKLVFINLPA